MPDDTVSAPVPQSAPRSDSSPKRKPPPQSINDPVLRSRYKRLLWQAADNLLASESLDINQSIIISHLCQAVSALCSQPLQPVKSVLPRLLQPAKPAQPEPLDGPPDAMTALQAHLARLRQAEQQAQAELPAGKQAAG